MMMIQLDPPLPFLDDAGNEVIAMMALDYGVDHETLFLCGYKISRTLWWVPHSRLRLVNNVSLGRPTPIPASMENPLAEPIEKDRPF